VRAHVFGHRSRMVGDHSEKYSGTQPRAITLRAMRRAAGSRAGHVLATRSLVADYVARDALSTKCLVVGTGRLREIDDGEFKASDCRRRCRTAGRLPAPTIHCNRLADSAPGNVAWPRADVRAQRHLTPRGSVPFIGGLQRGAARKSARGRQRDPEWRAA
jgi:hypothetical protein